MPDDVGDLIGPLRALSLDLDARDIADALWLAATTGVGAAPRPVPLRAADQSGIDEFPEPVEEPADLVDGTPAPTPADPDGLYDGASTGAGGQHARQVRIHRPRALPMPLDLARSLRAFDRRWRTGRRRELDLDASVATYARTGRLTPVFRPAPERWFDAVVLVDDSPSMAMWRDTATEFTALLRQLGAFRSVRTLTLTLDGQTPQVRNAAGWVTHPRQLRSPTGRRLVLVMSDCLAGAWSGRAVWQTLWDWARSTPTALINPLPSSLWRRTGLDLPAVRVTADGVGGASTTLRYQGPWELFASPTERWLPLPTPALTAQSMRRWANTLMRADPVGADAVLVPPTGRVGRVAPESGGVGESDPSAASLETFRQVASEEAFRLAVLSSPHDPVSLQLLDLLRDQLVPTATVGDMAEIIASGVATAERHAGNTVLRFRPELRPRLQQLLSAPEAWRIHEILTDYVATHAGTPGDLVLAVPDPAGTATLPADIQPFADASHSTLRLLGIVPQTSAPPGLAGLLSRATREDVLAAYRLATDLPNAPDDPRDLVRELERLETDGLPKPLEFAELLAYRAEPELAADLREWTTDQAEERGIVESLLQLRSGIIESRQRSATYPDSPLAGPTGRLWPLVKALQPLPCMQSSQDRNFVVRLLTDRLGSLMVEESPRALAHILSIVAACSRKSDGFEALLHILRELDGDTVNFGDLELLIEESTGYTVWTHEELERLFMLLRGVIFPDLVELYRQVAGPDAPELPPETSFREVIHTLAALNAEPDGLPKLIAFVEHLASGRRSEFAIELRRWADREAVRLGVVSELQRMRREYVAPLAGPPPNSPAYLVIRLEPDAIDPDRYQLSHWHQLGVSQGWQPQRGEDFFGSLEEVRRQVAVIVEDIESRWARYQPNLQIEFLLPNALLNLGVEQWSSPRPEPLGSEYPLAIRSLDRMRSPKWHRSWRRRWQELNDQLESTGTVEPESDYWIESESPIRRVTADLESKPHVTLLGLSSPPSPEAADELAVGLRAGVPVIVWHREGGGLDADFISELLRGNDPAAMLQRLRALRREAQHGGSDHLGRHLAVLWDDPDRPLITADDLPPGDAPQHQTGA